MFKALRAGKASKLGIALQNFDAASIFSPEDLLTSSIFERLQYLPASIFVRLISEKIKLPENSNLTTIQYWPRWRAKNRSYIEPDLLVRFEGEHKKICDLIVEAKRRDRNNAQNMHQWIGQLNAYFEEENELYTVGSDVYFLAIGGKMSRSEFSSFEFKDQRIDEKHLVQLDWSELAKRAFEMTREGTDNVSEKFILSDIVEILSQFGFFVPNYFNELRVPKGACWKEEHSD